VAILYQFLLALLLSVFQSCFVLFKGYFLSLEFTLYPYLIDHGFIPYKNILDQHFPSVFFGTFSLPSMSYTSSAPILIFFLLILLISNLLLYRYLVVSKNNHPLFWLFLYIVLMAYFSVNILWLETFVNFLLIIVLNLSRSKVRTSHFLIGIILSQVILLRPTLLPAIVFLSLYLSIFNYKNLLGFFVGLFASFCYLLINRNLKDFIDLAIVFNTSVYSKKSFLMPSLKQALVVLSVYLYTWLNFYQSKKSLIFICVTLGLVAAYPRFGFEHLQPFILFVTLSASSSHRMNWPLNISFVFLFIGLIILGTTRNRYGNYFYQPSLYQFAQSIAQIPGKEIYLFGASDLLYPLSGKLPVDKFYLPSLPWYLNYPNYKKLLFSKLKKTDSWVVVDTTFAVDGQKLIESASDIYEYIKMNYNLIETRENFEIYTKKS